MKMLRLNICASLPGLTTMTEVSVDVTGEYTAVSLVEQEWSMKKINDVPVGMQILDADFTNITLVGRRILDQANVDRGFLFCWLLSNPLVEMISSFFGQGSQPVTTKIHAHQTTSMYLHDGHG